MNSKRIKWYGNKEEKKIKKKLLHKSEKCVTIFEIYLIKIYLFVQVIKLTKQEIYICYKLKTFTNNIKQET